MAKVRLDDVWKEFGDSVAIKGLSLETEDGEFLVILGPAGAGKTTTLKLIAGLERPTRGRVYINDRDVTYLPANQRNVAMTFEDYALYPLDTVYQNMANPFGAMHPRPSREEMDAKIRSVAEMLQIDHLLDRRADQLSGGQKQRVALARSMVRQPDVFLFDEPLSHVDAKIRHAMRAELHRLSQVLMTTTVYVTHDYVEALSLADRVVVLDQGRVQQTGTPHEIYHRPANEFVANLVGQPRINVFPCHISGDGDEVVIRHTENPAITFTVPGEQKHRLGLYAGRTVRIGIRPQDIRFSLTPAAGMIEARTDVFEFLGTKGLLLASVGPSPVRVLTEPDVALPGDRPVWLDFSMATYYVFTAAGDRLP